MLLRFPPADIHPTDRTYLTGRSGTFAKLKIESQAGKRLVFLTEHTLLLVNEGRKLLHFADHTCTVTADELVLLRKGIYVMAEYIEPGLNFEAVLLFLPAKLLRSMAAELDQPERANESHRPYMVFPTNAFTRNFKTELQQYFKEPLSDASELLYLKQKEILLLLMSSGYRKEIGQFIREAAGTQPTEMEFIVSTHLFQPITLNELAGLCNRSLASFKRDFQRIYHCAPRQWINQQRLAQALLLLQNSDQSVADVGASCGYENSSYFIRLFKNSYGCTPAAHRAKTAIS